MATLLDQEHTTDLSGKNYQSHVLDHPPLYVDVRTPQEFQSVHISGSHNIPLADLHAHLDELKTLSQEQTIRLVCRTQNRVQIAYEFLTSNGLTNCDILEGGVTAWVAQGKPVIKGKHGISLEGQVRAIAGGLIVLGVGLGFAIHSGFFLVPAIVGVGLLHAGLTDSCLMGMMLSRLPMNRIAKSRTAIDKKGDEP